MKGGHQRDLSALATVGMLGGGGWQVRGGWKPLALEHGPVENAATLEDRMISVTTGSKTAAFPTDRIVSANPWSIEIMGSVMNRQQRKLADGGGWHDVPVIRTLLFLENPAIKEASRRAAEQAVAEDLERRRGLNNARRERERKALLSVLAHTHAGKTIAGFRMDEEGLLTISFMDAPDLTVGYHNESCENCEATAVVQGVSLRFEPERIRY